jgi:hypothetical protein
VYQVHQRGKWIRDRQRTGAFGSTFQEGERQRRTISFGPCAKQWVARLRLREYIEWAGEPSSWGVD